MQIQNKIYKKHIITLISLFILIMLTSEACPGQHKQTTSNIDASHRLPKKSHGPQSAHPVATTQQDGSILRNASYAGKRKSERSNESYAKKCKGKNINENTPDCPPKKWFGSQPITSPVDTKQQDDGVVSSDNVIDLSLFKKKVMDNQKKNTRKHGKRQLSTIKEEEDIEVEAIKEKTKTEVIEVLEEKIEIIEEIEITKTTRKIAKGA